MGAPRVLGHHSRRVKIRAAANGDNINSRPTIPAPASAPEDDDADESGVYATRHSQSDLALRIPSLSLVPMVRMSPAELRGLPLDPTSAFLLGVMDGVTNLETLLDMAPVPREDALRSLALLVDYGVIQLR